MYRLSSPCLEYKVAIYDEHYKKLWDVTYSEYIPNKLDWDLPSSTVPTDVYIAPDATRAIGACGLPEAGHCIHSRSSYQPIEGCTGA